MQTGFQNLNRYGQNKVVYYAIIFSIALEINSTYKLERSEMFAPCFKSINYLRINM